MSNKTLEIFKVGINFSHWGEIYSGCKAQLITPQNVLYFCEEDKIININKTQCVNLYIALENSLNDFYETIKSFIIEDKETPINKNEDELNDFYFEYIPSEYFRIWELKLLLKVRNSSVCKIEKLKAIADLFYIMNYPEVWKNFLYYQPQTNNEILSIDELYDNFLAYVETQIKK